MQSSWFLTGISEVTANKHPGLPAPRGRDDAIYASHRPPPLHHPPQDVQLHVWTLSPLCRTAAHIFPSSESPLVAKLQYGMKITFIFILILFIDSVNRVYRVQLELAEANKTVGYVPHTPLHGRQPTQPNTAR